MTKFSFLNIEDFNVTMKELFLELDVNVFLTTYKRDNSTIMKNLNCNTFRPILRVYNVTPLTYKSYKMICSETELETENQLIISFDFEQPVPEYSNRMTSEHLFIIVIEPVDKNFDTTEYVIVFNSDTSFFNGKTTDRTEFYSLPCYFGYRHIINMGLLVTRFTDDLWSKTPEFNQFDADYTMMNPSYNYKPNKQANTMQLAFSFSKLFANQPMTTVFIIP